MPVAVYYRNDYTEVPDSQQGIDALRWIAENINADLSNMRISNLVLNSGGFYHEFRNTDFVACRFVDARLSLCSFTNCGFIACDFSGDSSWLNKEGIKVVDCNIEVTQTRPNTPTNDEIAKRVRGKVYSLPNKDFVKIKATCDFCHKDFYQIMKRSMACKFLRSVPNCDKQICESCYKFYDISHKERGNRTYGYRGPLSFFRTPMDKRNTAILGLEMEFEGDFYGWKELQDAHQGNLHFGYDSSVRGENELSWDCGSYSWWKYLAPLKDVCDALKKYGGSEGDTAGIHIHVSRPDVSTGDITKKINTYCRRGAFNIMMRAVSCRKDKTRFAMYADLNAEPGSHHAGISYNSHGTCEFRIFNSSLDHKKILRHLKLCKEFFNLVAENTPQELILKSFSKETKKHIRDCGLQQIDNGFITKEEYETLLEEMK